MVLKTIPGYYRGAIQEDAIDTLKMFTVDLYCWISDIYKNQMNESIISLHPT